MSEIQTKADPAFTCEIEPGDAVRWYYLGPDELTVQDVGLGIITAVQEHPWPKGHMTYHVLCKDEVLRIFPRRYLKFLF